MIKQNEKPLILSIISSRFPLTKNVGYLWSYLISKPKVSVDIIEKELEE
jgi:hypothetical protein